jgi:competence protein ComEC
MSLPAGSQSLIHALHRRPFVVAAGVFMLGIGLHRRLPADLLVWFSLAGGCLIMTRVRWRMVANLALAVAMFLAGLIAAQIEAFQYPTNHISQFTTDQPRLVWLEMRVDEVPRLLTNSAHGGRPLPPRQVTQGSVLRVLTTAGWRPATGLIQVQVHEPNASLGIGQRIQTIGMIERPDLPMNPGQFDWAEYYREQRILASLQIPHSQNIRILASPGPGLLDWLRIKSRELLARGFTDSQSLDHALLRALVLGDSDPQLRDVQDYFIQTGTSHHLAISGMHIAILGSLIYLGCRLLRLSPRLSVWIGLAFTVLYGLVALPSPPVVRSVVLCVAFGFGIVSRRSIDGIQLLAVSVFLMLAYHPLDLYNAGFQLSFGTVLGLMLFVRPATEFLRSFRDPHMQIAARLQKSTPVAAAGRGVRDWAQEAILTGLVAWLVSAPLIAYNFHQLNPWGIPATIILAFPVLWSLVGGLFKILLTLILPPLAPIFATIAAMPVVLMRRTVQWLALFPGNDVPLPAPPLWLVILFYILLLIPLLPASRRPVKWLFRSSTIFACILFPLLLFLSRPAAPAGQTTLTLLSVGAGQCAAVQLSSGKMILIDVGSSSVDLYRRTLAPYFKFLGRSRIDSIYLSHVDYDHVSAAGDTIAHCSPQNLFVTPYFPQHARGNRFAEEILNRFSATGHQPQMLAAGRHIVLDEESSLDILWPPADRQLSTNNSSMVLRLTTHGRSILFTGDIQQVAEQEIQTNPLVHADILVAPHHGSSEATTAAFVAAVDPRIILSSNARRLTQKQRTFDGLAAGRALYRTNRWGAVTVRVERDGRMKVETFGH